MKTQSEYLDLYSDFLLSSFGATTATALSRLLEGAVSHDQVTRFLDRSDYGPKQLWLSVKPMIREGESEDGALVIDDSIIEKPHSKQNDLICYHWDHANNRHVKGINLLSVFYQNTDLRVPITYHLVEKKIKYIDPKTNKERRKSAVNKNEMARAMLDKVAQNQVKFLYVLADKWFASNDNMNKVDALKKIFIFDLSSVRLLALSEREKKNGQYTKLSELGMPENSEIVGYLKGVKFPVKIIRQVVKKDGELRGERYLVTNALEMDFDQITTTYQRRWSVEVYHKSLKQNASIAKSPTKIVKTQKNHIFASLFAYLKLEKLRLNHNIGHFALKTKLYSAAIFAAFKELRTFSRTAQFFESCA